MNYQNTQDCPAGLSGTKTMMVRTSPNQPLFVGAKWAPQTARQRNIRAILAAELGKNPASLSTEELSAAGYRI